MRLTFRRDVLEIVEMALSQDIEAGWAHRGARSTLEKLRSAYSDPNYGDIVWVDNVTEADVQNIINAISGFQADYPWAPQEDISYPTSEPVMTEYETRPTPYTREELEQPEEY